MTREAKGGEVEMRDDTIALLGLLAVMVEKEKMLDPRTGIVYRVHVGVRAAYVRSFAFPVRGRGFAALAPTSKVNRSRHRTEDASLVSSQERNHDAG